MNLSGTSSVDCKTVYSQKVYDFVHFCIGYNFVNCLYRDKNSILNADDILLNNIVEQDGGGGRDLFAHE